MADGAHRMEERSLGLVLVVARRLHVQTITSKALTPIVHLLPPIRIRRRAELIANSFEGSIVVIVLIPGMGLVPRKGDAYLHEKVPECIINVKAIQACNKGVFGLKEILI